jgi:hypothetical protein
MQTIILRTFTVDVTPPIGGFLCGGFHPQSVGFESQLFLRGAILSDQRQTVVLATINYTYLSGRSQQRLIDAIARGVGVPASHVALHSDHVHAAPLIDEEPHAIVAKESKVQLHDESYFRDVLWLAERNAKIAAESNGMRIGGVGFSEQRVEQFASARRVLDAGQCKIRWSVCRDEKVRNAPEGQIDPILSQVVFFDESRKPVAQMSFYASHPQVSDGRLLISADTVGIATDLFQAKHPGVFPMYFSGCAGDVTAGKYTTLDLARNRHVFGVRLYDGILGAFEKAQPMPVDSIGWADESFELPLAPISDNAEHYLSRIRNPNVPDREKYQAAMRADRLLRNVNTYPFRLNRLRLGDFDVLFLPSELVLEYQLFAKKQARGKLAVAAYGDSFLKYVATDEMFAQGGYEVAPNWTEVQQGIEQPIKKSIQDILKREI